MMASWAWWLLPLGGYLLGSLAFAVWLPRCVAGVDIRLGGSGHAGATNTMRHIGWRWGVAVFVLDALKGYAAVGFAQAVGAPVLIVALTAAAVVAGHIWPAFAGFRGGMGNATTFGALLAVSPLGALLAVGWLIAWVLALRHTARANALAAATAWALFWALGLTGAPLAVAVALAPVVTLRFAQDWQRQYRELWLDRPAREPDEGRTPPS